MTSVSGSAQPRAVARSGSHTARANAREASAPYLFSRLTVISGTSAPGVKIDTA